MTPTLNNNTADVQMSILFFFKNGIKFNASGYFWRESPSFIHRSTNSFELDDHPWRYLIQRGQNHLKLKDHSPKFPKYTNSIFITLCCVWNPFHTHSLCVTVNSTVPSIVSSKLLLIIIIIIILHHHWPVSCSFVTVVLKMWSDALWDCLQRVVNIHTQNSDTHMKCQTANIVHCIGMICMLTFCEINRWKFCNNRRVSGKYLKTSVHKTNVICMAWCH